MMNEIKRMLYIYIYIFKAFGGNVVCNTLMYGFRVFGSIVSLELSRTPQQVVSESGSAWWGAEVDSNIGSTIGCRNSRMGVNYWFQM
jgi:hypothetical protein